MKKLLFLGTSYATCALIERAKERGMHTIVTDYLSPSESVGKLISDEYWMINTNEIDLLSTKCAEEGVDGVVCGCSEFNADMALKLTKRLNLPFYCTEEAWHYSRDKYDFKKVCRELGVPVAKDYFIDDINNDKELKIIDYPVVVKPVDLSGNRGISFCYNEKELREGYLKALSVSKSNKIVIEKMLHGEEYYGTYAIANGEPTLLGLQAMYHEKGYPTNCYTLTTTVSSNIDRFCEEINPHILRLLKRIGCTEGIAWVQVMLDSANHFYVIELGYRLDGELTFFPYKGLLDFNVLDWLIDNSLGVKHSIKDLPPNQNGGYTGTASGVLLWADRSGVLSSYEGGDYILSRFKENNITFETLKQIGNHFDKYRPLGVITFSTENYEEMENIMVDINKNVHFYDADNNDVVIKYTDFNSLKRIYQESIKIG